MKNWIRFITALVMVSFSAAGYPQWTVGSRSFGGGPWTYYTSTSPTATQCTATYGVANPCSAINSYNWSSQSVSGTITLYVVTSGAVAISQVAGNGEAVIYYSTNGGCNEEYSLKVYNYANVGTLSWTDDIQSTTISLTDLSNLCVQLYAYGDAASVSGASVTSQISPVSIYVTVSH